MGCVVFVCMAQNGHLLCSAPHCALADIRYTEDGLYTGVPQVRFNMSDRALAGCVCSLFSYQVAFNLPSVMT